jgi:hypothetical protein
MSDCYVNPAVGASGTGGSWAQAYKTLAEATAAASAGDTIYFANGTADVIAVDVGYNCAAGVRVISTSDTTNNPPTTYAAGATVSSTTSGVDVTVAGACAWYGVTIALGDSTDANSIVFGAADGDEQLFVDCAFTLGGSNTSGLMRCGAAGGTGAMSVVTFQNCSFTWGSTSNSMRCYTHAHFVGCNLSAGATHPTQLINPSIGDFVVSFTGCDLSNIGTVFIDSAAGHAAGVISQCKLKSGGTVYSSGGAGRGQVFVFDSAVGDSHIEMAHYTYAGSTVCSGSVYANDNIADSNLSWLVSSTANASRAIPYKSPWLDVYHAGTSAITPYLECLRSGSTTAYKESELWSEWLVKATASSTRSTLYSNELGPLATTGNNESSSKGASEWTGEDASNNWYGKLQPNATVTPSEAGHIRARVCLGVASSTVYVDPQIRGLS